MGQNAEDKFNSLFNDAAAQRVETVRPGLRADELDALNDAATLGFYLKYWSGVAEFRGESPAARMIELAVLNRSLSDIARFEGAPPGLLERLKSIVYREHDPMLRSAPAYYVYEEQFTDDRRLVTKPYWQVGGPRGLQCAMGALLTRLVQRDIKAARHLEGGYAVITALAQAYQDAGAAKPDPTAH